MRKDQGQLRSLILLSILLRVEPCVCKLPIIAAIAVATQTVAAQTTTSFGDLAAGPYNRLVIRGAMVIPGHGGPPAGPYDIVIERNVITEMIPFDPVTAERRGAASRPTGDRVIDADGKFVMPGMIDLHTHIRTAPQENEYAWYLRLAHGVTGMVNAPDRGLDSALYQAEALGREHDPRAAHVARSGAGARRRRTSANSSKIRRWRPRSRARWCRRARASSR